MDAACEAAPDEPVPAPDPAGEGIDWIRTDEGDFVHPLQHRCAEASLRLHRQCKKLGLDAELEDGLDDLLFEFHMTSAKLAGALGTIAQGDDPLEPAFTVASLKRALNHLHRAQAGLEAYVSKRAGSRAKKPRLAERLVIETRQELFAIREEILRLMQAYRERQ
jgi:hypothetical protein